MARQDSGEELDKYINDMTGITDDQAAVTDDESVDDGQGADTTSDEQATGVAPQDAGAALDGAVQQPQADGKKGKQPEQGKQAATPQPPRPLGDGTFTDAEGNIVDGTGKLIAQKGFVARIYNTNKRLKAQLDDRSTQLNELATRVGEVQALSRSITSHGLDNDDVAKALDFAGRMKKGDVLGVAKDILAMVTAQGYNVTELLGQDVGDSIEMRGLKRMLDERLAPLTREDQARTAQAEAERVGRQNYERFVADNEYADVHANDIVSLMQRDNINPQTAYNRLYQFVVQNGLDFTMPLKPQIEARMAQQQGQPQVPNGHTVQRPMPNGGATRRSGAVPTIALANADDDWGSIINEVQRTLQS